MSKITMKGSPISIKGTMPKIGSNAPDFVLVNADLKNISLSDFRGKKKVISIVPSLDTAVCLLSTKKFNQEAANYKNTVILVVSSDLPFAQKRVCGAENISNITSLSCMRSQKFASDYGVLIEDGPLEGICARAIVVLSEDDRVLYTELVSELGHEPNYENVLKIIKG